MHVDTAASIEKVPHWREGRELAVLTGGPWAGAWYWRDDFEAQQATAQAALHRGARPEVGQKLKYRPTEQWQANPSPDPQLHGVLGRVWEWAPGVPVGQEVAA